jgi:LEA14-like dessication related protein
MVAKKWIGLLLGAAAVYWIYNKFKFSQSLSFIPTKINVGGNILNPEISLGVKLFNPSNVSTSFSNLDAELFLENGQKVADVYYNQKINIPAKSETELNILANTSFSNLLTSLKDIFTSKQLNFVVKGVASIDNIPLPFTINYKFFA